MSVDPVYLNYINGAFVDGSAGRIMVDNPSTGEDLAEQAIAGPSDVNAAVEAARACHESRVWQGLRPIERGRVIQKMAEFFKANHKEIGHVLCLESGKPLWEAEMDALSAGNFLEYYGNQASTVEGKSIPLGDGYMDYTILEPLGVSAQIIPWNFPLEITARGIGPALATGNTCVVKSPELDPLSHKYFALAAEYAGLPAGALNIICGLGHEAGAVLSNHADINQMVFTGSVATGTAVAVAAAKNIVPCVLELGGKSAAIVYPDADIDGLMESLRWGIYFNAGQVCSAMSRMIVHADVYDEVVERAGALASSITPAEGIQLSEYGPNMGAMMSAKQRDRAVGLAQNAVKEGATLVTGGNALNQPGYFMQPTVFADVTPDMEINREEVFGPVVSTLKFIDEQQALDVANGTDFGLVSGVFTKDLDRATRAARGLKAGQVYVNEWFAGGVETPFGGIKKSGYGREKGRDALWNYVASKNVGIRVGG